MIVASVPIVAIAILVVNVLFAMTAPIKQIAMIISALVVDLGKSLQEYVMRL